MSQKHLTMAIDCGEQTGIAIYDSTKKKITKTLTTDFYGAIRFVKTLEKETVKIIVEVPSDFIYARNDFQKGSLRDNMAIKIGGNRREAQLLARGLRILGFAVEEVLPIRAKKWTAEQLKRYLGIDSRTNQHVRDACRLAYFHAGTRF